MEFLNKQTYKQTQFAHKGYNPWIPNNKLTEIELDLIDMGDDEKNSTKPWIPICPRWYR